MKFTGKLSITRPSYGDGRERISIELKDDLSAIRFLNLEIKLDDFARALTGFSQMPFTGELKAVESVGKKKVREERKAIYPFDHCNRQAAEQWLRDNCQEEGWKVDTYLGSQGSKTPNGDGTYTLHYGVFKFVEWEPSDEQDS